MMNIDIRRRQATRVVLVYGILAGILGLLYLLFISSLDIGAAFRAYHYAASRSIAGEAFYGVSAPSYDSTYIYPPVTIVFFFPLALIESWKVAFAVMTIANIIFAGLIATIIIRYIDSASAKIPLLDQILILAYLLFSILTVQVYLQGQINVFLASAIAYGFINFQRGDERPAGFLFAFAALFKYFPSLLGIYFLKRRAYQAVGASVLTGTSFLFIGYLIFGRHIHEQYLSGVLASRYIFSGGLSPTVNLVTFWRPLSYAFVDYDPVVYFVVSVLLIFPLIGYVYIQTSTADGELIAMLATVVGTIMILPSKFPYLVILHFPLVPALYLIEDRLVHRILVIGTAVVSLVFNLEHIRKVSSLFIPFDGFRFVLFEFLEPMLTVATPPLYGLLILFIGCIVHAYRTDGGGDETGHEI